MEGDFAAVLHPFRHTVLQGQAEDCEVLGMAMVLVLKPHNEEGKRAEANTTGVAFKRCLEEFQSTQATELLSRLHSRHETDHKLVVLRQIYAQLLQRTKTHQALDQRGGI